MGIEEGGSGKTDIPLGQSEYVVSAMRLFWDEMEQGMVFAVHKSICLGHEYSSLK